MGRGGKVARAAKISIMVAGAAALAVALGAAGRPSVLAKAEPGLWELSGGPVASRGTRMCIADPAALVQIEHKRASCTRVVVRDQPSVAEIHYTCPNGGFGQTKITMITPRSLRVETQGISANEPFYYVFQARRAGKCPTH